MIELTEHEPTARQADREPSIDVADDKAVTDRIPSQALDTRPTSLLTRTPVV